MGGLRKAMPITFATMTVGTSRAGGPAAVLGVLLQGGGARGRRGVSPARGSRGVLGGLDRVARRPGDRRGDRRLRHAPVVDDILRRRTHGVGGARVVTGDAVAAHRARRAGDRCSGWSANRDWLPSWLDLPYEGHLTWGPGQPQPLHVGLATSGLSVLLAAVGFAAVLMAWRRAPAEDPSLRLVRLRPALVNAFYVDELYDRLFVRPVRLAASSVRWTDDEVIVDRGRWLRARRDAARRAAAPHAAGQRADLSHRPARGRRDPGRRGGDPDMSFPTKSLAALTMPRGPR